MQHVPWEVPTKQTELTTVRNPLTLQALLELRSKTSSLYSELFRLELQSSDNSVSVAMRSRPIKHGRGASHTRRY